MYDIPDETHPKLHRCKHCDGNAILKQRPHAYWIECESCGYSIRYFLHPINAIDSWNKQN